MSGVVRAERGWGGICHASAIRNATIGVWLVIVVFTPYQRYSSLSPELFAPYGPVGGLISYQPLRSLLLSSAMLLMLKSAAVAGCIVSILWPNLWRPLILVVCVVVVILDALTKAFGGFANHAQVAPLLALVVLSFHWNKRFLPGLARWRGVSSPGGDASVWYADEEGPSDNSYTSLVWLVALVIVVPYTYIGLNRLVTGGIELFRGDTLLFYFAGASHGFAAYGGRIDMEMAMPALKLGFVAITLLEASAVVTLLSSLYRVVWLCAMTSFHVMTLLLMNILFWENLALAWVIFWWGWKDPSTLLQTVRLQRPHTQGGDEQ